MKAGLTWVIYLPDNIPRQSSVKLIYTSENRFLVGNARNIVENSGIKVIVKNEYAPGGVGELSPMDTWPELWVVNDCDYEAAMQLIEKAVNPENAQEWRCRQCNEMNDASFEYCWKCHCENS